MLAIRLRPEPKRIRPFLGGSVMKAMSASGQGTNPLAREGAGFVVCAFAGGVRWGLNGKG
jgi:hypothetical protein